MPGQILVVDDQLLCRMILRAGLGSACYETMLASTATEGLALATAHLPDLILLDYNLPDGDGMDVCARLRANPKTRNIPIILVSSDTSRATRLRALDVGADDFLPKPIDEAHLLSRIRVLLRHSAIEREYKAHGTGGLRVGLAEAGTCFAGPTRVTLVCTQAEARTDDPVAGVDATLYQTRLALPDLLGAPEQARKPDLLILSPGCMDQAGLNIIADLRARHTTRQLPIAVVLRPETPTPCAMVLDLGADEVLRLPLDTAEFHLRLKAMLRRKQRHDALRRALGTELDMALRDSLTGLFNRRHAMAHLSGLLDDANRSAGFSILLIDMDNFKSVNDRFGHVAGDDVLTEAAARMASVTRPQDMLARFGGEEFLLVLPLADMTQATCRAEALRRAIEDRPFQLPTGEVALQVTASIGVAVHHGGATEPVLPLPDQIREIIDRADQAMRMAKSTGRNRVSTMNSAVA